MTECTIQLAPGDSLLLYTDGLTEAFSPDGDLFGETRLAEALSASQSVTSDGLIQSVEESLNEFIQSTPLGDDLTMLVIRRAKASGDPSSA
jgi:sigma-B regulation protein RsbU (phosphoserine phosphatase)